MRVLKAENLNLGCACDALGAVANYDIITIGGKQYSVNQIVDKTVVANADVKAYSNPSGNGTLVGTIKKGQTIGKVFAHMRPDQANGYAWLMFETSYNKYFYVPADGASVAALQQQGAKTVEVEVKEEAEKAKKENDTIGYYIEKYAIPTVLGAGGIYVAVQLGKQLIASWMANKKSKAQPALSGAKAKK